MSRRSRRPAVAEPDPQTGLPAGHFVDALRSEWTKLRSASGRPTGA